MIAKPHNHIAFLLRITPYVVLITGILLRALTDIPWIPLAISAAGLALVYPFLWIEEKMKKRDCLKSSRQCQS